MTLIRHRETARVLLQASSGRFLLMFTLWDPGSGLEPRWVSPGGGVEASEDLAEAAVRELFEETGLRVNASKLGQKIAAIEFSQNWASGGHETGTAHFFKLEIEEEFDISKALWTAEEHRDILEVRWWNPYELKEAGESVGPPGLIDLMLTHLSK